MNLTEKQLQEIAELLGCGLLCYLNKTTGTVEHFPEEMDLMLDEKDPWQEIKDEIEQNPENYLEFEPMDSRQSFNVMRDFTEEIEDERFRNRLIDALNRSRPFRNFKYLIENSGKYRQKWFDFRLAQYVICVKEQLQSIMRQTDD